MLSRPLAKLVTGPFGFFVAGIVDVTAAWGRWAAGALGARVRAGARRGSR